MANLAKKQNGGASVTKVTTTKASTPAKKKTITDVSRNPQYKSSGVLNSEGKMMYQRKKGSGPSKVAEGTPAASNFKKGGSTKSKKK